MRNLIQLLAVFIIAFSCSAFAADVAVRVQDPSAFCENLFADISPFKAKELAKSIATTIGKQEAAENIENAMKLLDGKKVDFAKKVVDRDINGALRQIIYYTYIQDIGFLYFRFNFKMSGTGWVLANFIFKSETNELFPKDFVDH
jgi:hypothetical protein